MAKAKKPSRTKATDKAVSKRYGWLKRMAFNRFTKTIMAILVVFAMLPIVFTLLYAVPSTTPASTLMMGRALIGKSVDRQWVSIDAINPVLAQSVLMSEDGQFCFHGGVDWNELNSVIDDALDGEKTRGASTLAMQAVKNLFLWPQRSFIRKAFEVPYAIFADLIWSKRRMMEIYLNIAEFDEGVFGAEAAAQHYFNRPASKLTRRQAALLAVSLPNPKARNPAKPSKSLLRLARVVEKRAKQSGAYVKCLKK